jgi:hypothetical protein
MLKTASFVADLDDLWDSCKKLRYHHEFLSDGTAYVCRFHLQSTDRRCPGSRQDNEQNYQIPATDAGTRRHHVLCVSSNI